eukprot:1308728-Alexandrium_andersonii.AAC.1
MADWAHLSRRHPAEDTDGAVVREGWSIPLAPPMSWAESTECLAAFGRALRRLRPPPLRTRSDPAPLPPPPPPPPSPP